MYINRQKNKLSNQIKKLLASKFNLSNKIKLQKFNVQYLFLVTDYQIIKIEPNTKPSLQ